MKWLILLILTVPAAVQAQFSYEIIQGSVRITGYDCVSGEETIPGAIDGMPVTRIGYRALFGRRLTSVTIPNSVLTIEWEAFLDCTTLTDVTIPGSDRRIERGTFSRCSSLASVKIPNSAIYLEGYVFDGCASLESVSRAALDVSCRCLEMNKSTMRMWSHSLVRVLTIRQCTPRAFAFH